MKPFTLIFVLLFSGSILFSGCGKKADHVNPLYVGYWYASTADNDYTLVIDENSEARYNISSGLMTYTEYTGKARISNDYIRIGWKKFHLDQEPQVSPCGACTLVIDGVELRK